MPRPNRIIALAAFNLLVAAVMRPAVALERAQPGYAAYEVRLEVVRNGTVLGRPERIVAAGEPATADLFTPGRPAPLRISHRVTGFPGAEDSKALLELEVFRIEGGVARRLVAPTIGVDLGLTQFYDIPTTQGTLRIRALVDGLSTIYEAPGDGPRGIPYPQG